MDRVCFWGGGLLMLAHRCCKGRILQPIKNENKWIMGTQRKTRKNMLWSANMKESLLGKGNSTPWNFAKWQIEPLGKTLVKYDLKWLRRKAILLNSYIIVWGLRNKTLGRGLFLTVSVSCCSKQKLSSATFLSLEPNFSQENCGNLITVVVAKEFVLKIASEQFSC